MYLKFDWQVTSKYCEKNCIKLKNCNRIILFNEKRYVLIQNKQEQDTTYQKKKKIKKNYFLLSSFIKLPAFTIIFMNITYVQIQICNILQE